ncbi:hypothetical protein [Corynebacterium suicordis]|uniref:ATP/GTP-binding protein n=1 Tax=Corynebacterium suicordis DSM 45110 TaxID=1121369 RepID=A0ABR9ZP71_9CORY|nr:hypothetical protein [Corynebacterium suicordis]MBF4554382.1 hypothetical protein [Corynebacterium suicordis DSM 45110]MDR6278594.1 hypothetical protein [Corynebacterium suicordis]
MTKGAKGSKTKAPKKGYTAEGVYAEWRLEELKEKAQGSGPSAAWARQLIIRDANLRRIKFGDASGDTTDSWRKSHTMTARGMMGELGGPDFSVGAMPESRGTTDVVAGFYPWSVGAGSPPIGPPIGYNLMTGEPVQFDATGYKLRGGGITAPIVMIIALNGFGKSTLGRRLQSGAVAQGRTSLVLGDCKPDFRDQVEAMTDAQGNPMGQVIELGHGLGSLNPLDVGLLGVAGDRISALAKTLEKAEQLRDEISQREIDGLLMPAFALRWRQMDADERSDWIREVNTRARKVKEELRSRQTMMVASLVQLVRRSSINEFEETMISSAISRLYDVIGCTHDRPPLLEDLYELIRLPSSEMMLDAGIDPRDGDDVRPEDRLRAEEEYRQDIKPLVRSLRALIRGEFGEIFNGQTTTRLELDAAAIDVDVSNIPHSDASPLRGAVLLACWGEGFGAVEAAHHLADMGLERKRTFQIIMDELWQVLQSHSSMISKVNQLSRLNRQTATELVMITHSMADLTAFDSKQSQNEADGLIERSRVKFFGPLPQKELNRLRDVVEFSETAQNMLVNWSAPPAVAGEAVRPGEKPPPPPGTGKFVMKVNERGADIAFQLVRTPVEMSSGVHNTDKRYDDAALLNSLDDDSDAFPDFETFSVAVE